MIYNWVSIEYEPETMKLIVEEEINTLQDMGPVDTNVSYVEDFNEIEDGV